MMLLRALGLAAALALVGCSDDTTSGASTDLSQPVLDLSMPGTVCGANVCHGACVVCVQISGGLCAIPCSTAMPSTCASGTCNPAVPDGGNGDGVVFTGACAAFNGFCS
ncbi:MAG TPA: hypothetical protein VF997_16725 [Polyangia bacterium]